MTVKEARHNSGYSIGAISSKLGISPNEWKRYERKPYTMTTGTAIIFSRIVNVPVDFISFAKRSTKCGVALKNIIRRLFS